MEPQNMESQKQGNGALWGAIIIVVILVIGGIYLLQKTAEKREIEETVPPTPEEESSDLSSVEAEVDQMDFEELDTGI